VSWTGWKNVARYLATRPPHEDVTIPKSTIKHPVRAGFVRTLGEPRGQLADYEYVLPDGGRIHVREYEDHYEVHRDLVSPLVDPLSHLRTDAPHWYVALLALAGGATSGALTAASKRKPEEILAASAVGAIAGAILGLISLPGSE
jgi:hypothetical protein